MEIVISEQQILMLENNHEAWGCNLFPKDSEDREWCKTAQSKIDWSRTKQIETQIARIAESLRTDAEIEFRDKVKFYSEEDPFFSENIENLNKLKEYLSLTCDKAEESINNLLKNLEEKFLFVEKQGEKFIYSQLTKLNSNYSALAFLLTEYRRRKKLQGQTFDDVFNEYFMKSTGLGESPFFNLIISNFSKKEEAVNLINGVIQTIRNTERIGRESEEQAYKILADHFGEENVVIFSGDYSWADFLGADMIVHEDTLGWGWVPVQVKTRLHNCKPNKRFCKNICMGKKRFSDEWGIKLYDGENEINPSNL